MPRRLLIEHPGAIYHPPSPRLRPDERHEPWGLPGQGSVQKLLPVLAGAPPGQMRGPREGVYPLRYSTD